MSFRSWLKAHLPPSDYRRLVRTVKVVLAWWYQNDLNRLADLFKTDKWGHHWYTQHYQRYFAPLRNKRLNVLEIGVGGYEFCDRGGASLRMWKAYFRKSQIIGIDLYDKRHFSEKRIDIRQCDQTDREALTCLAAEYGGFDIVIDDGSHLNEHVIKTFRILFPLLRKDGIYVVEDTQTAYWPTWGGGLNERHTSTAFFKAMTDGLNYVEYPVTNYQPSYFDRHVVEISFFHNLIFICKGNNDEHPNAPELIQQELTATTGIEANLHRH
jgi:hypothetical protein